MAFDFSKFAMHSDYPMDKIVHIGEIDVYNDGVTIDPVDLRIVEARIPNPYIRKTFIRYVWSVDGLKNGAESKMFYSYKYTEVSPLPPGTFTADSIRAAVSVGVNDSEIIFRTGNGYHGDVVYNGTTMSYTPIPQTFHIEYALFEME